MEATSLASQSGSTHRTLDQGKAEASESSIATASGDGGLGSGGTKKELKGRILKRESTRLGKERSERVAHGTHGNSHIS